MRSRFVHVYFAPPFPGSRRSSGFTGELNMGFQTLAWIKPQICFYRRRRYQEAIQILCLQFEKVSRLLQCLTFHFSGCQRFCYTFSYGMDSLAQLCLFLRPDHWESRVELCCSFFPYFLLYVHTSPIRNASEKSIQIIFQMRITSSSFRNT